MEFITDRTQADVDRVKALSAKGWANMTAEEQAEWSAGMKGAYTYMDLNRVEKAVSTIASFMGLTVDTKTDWTAADFPTAAEMNRFLGNIKALRAAAPPLFGVPDTPSTMSKMTYKKANDIEKILKEMHTVVDSAPRCGEYFAGEV